MLKRLIIACAFLLNLACNQKKPEPLFTKLDASASGITFSNDLNENDSTNSFIDEFGYMGGGVGIGDFNNDGLADVFFTGNQVSSRLYINKGKNHFEDITSSAGVTTDSWATGVSVADVNNDGYDDIYVCVFGRNLAQRAKNLLFINQHDLTFKEQASAYGLADTGYSTQAVFFDYDRDGDLDMYLTNYLLNGPNANNIAQHDRSGHSPANDKLFRNDGDNAGLGHPSFTDVSIEAGIREDGLGLGVVVSDLNNDGWPDVYVANDFISNDVLWLNNRNGTFTNVIARSIQHQSYSSMGADAADINNDGLPDIITLDMLPEYNDRKKTTFSFMNYERYQAERSAGYEPEFMRNMLQLNNGTVSSGDTSIPFFSEIGQLAGISATDWSWSVLIADFNNDGRKDIHITNGIGRDFINADFLEFSNDIFQNGTSTGQQHRSIKNKLEELSHVNLGNYLYLNDSAYAFTDCSKGSGVEEPSMSNGAAYADLDNDGDLDLIVNNIDKKAFVLINNSRATATNSHHFLRLHLAGDSLNPRAFGTKVIVYTRTGRQVQEENPVRGYFSSVDQNLFFGLGDATHIDSLIALWPDGKQTTLRDLKADSLVTVSHALAAAFPQMVSTGTDSPQNHPLFSDITGPPGIVFQHRESSFNDFAVQRLLPQKFSQLGPFIAPGDVNGDGKTGFFIGNGFNFSGKIFTQLADSFQSKNLTDGLKLDEDADCLFFDADSDGDQDLLVTNGEALYSDTSIHFKPRLYLNDGKGNFTLNDSAIPAGVRNIAGCVKAADYDADGDLDIFIGGRVSKNYPVFPRSFLLQNNKGTFTDVTQRVCPALLNPGMITGAVWTDFDGDKRPDLILAGEWMPLRFFKNTGSGLKEATGATGIGAMNGMWQSLVAADIDGDGDEDLIAGNLGMNCIYKADENHPMQLYAADLDGNGTIDPVPFYYIKDEDGERRSYPALSRSQLSDQVPQIKKQFFQHKDFAAARFDDIFENKSDGDIVKLHCNETRSCWFENAGHGKFIRHALPVEAQFAPVNAIICDDLDRDGYKDLLLAGNEYQTDVVTGRYDASYGCLLKGGPQKKFIWVPPVKCGFIVKGDVKNMAMIRMATGENIILVGVNDEQLRVFAVNEGSGKN